MSRSRVKRGLACTTTATPPTTTKSIPAPASIPSNAVGRKSGQVATARFAGACEFARLLVHAFKALQPLCRGERELLANQALIDRRPARSRGDDQFGTSSSQRAVQRGDSRVRFRLLELRYRCLADREPPREIGLRESGAPARGGKQSARARSVPTRSRTGGDRELHTPIITQNFSSPYWHPAVARVEPWSWSARSPSDGQPPDRRSSG